MKFDKSKRDFFKFSLGATGCVALLNPKDFLARNLLAPIQESTKPLLAVVQGETEKAVEKALEILGGMENFIQSGQTVLLKPNASFPNPPHWGSNTNPELVKAVALHALKVGASRVFVADNTMREGMESFNRSGLTEVLADVQRVKVLPIQEESLFTEVMVPNGKALKTVKIAKLLQKVDVLINLPCAKSHSATDVSFGLKNNMGVIWNRNFFHTGTNLHEAIAELATVIRPHLTILDATRALVTGGPTGPGKVQELNTVIAGMDPLAVDAYATTLVNWNNRSLKPKMIKHLLSASRLGVGEIELENIHIQKIVL